MKGNFFKLAVQVIKIIVILSAFTNWTFLMRLVGKKKTLPTLH